MNFEELKDEFLGVVGTPDRDSFEEESQKIENVHKLFLYRLAQKRVSTLTKRELPLYSAKETLEIESLLLWIEKFQKENIELDSISEEEYKRICKESGWIIK